MYEELKQSIKGKSRDEQSTLTAIPRFFFKVRFLCCISYSLPYSSILLITCMCIVYQLPSEEEVLKQKLREEARAVFLQRRSRQLLDNDELQVRLLTVVMN